MYVAVFNLFQSFCQFLWCIVVIISDGKRTVLLDNSPSDIPLPCSVMARVRSWVSRVRVGSVGLGLVGLVLGLGLELGLGLWFGLKGNVREKKCSWRCPTLIVRRWDERFVVIVHCVPKTPLFRLAIISTDIVRHKPALYQNG